MKGMSFSTDSNTYCVGSGRWWDCHGMTARLLHDE